MRFPKKLLHIISFYNLSGRDQGYIRTNRNRYLERVLSDAAQIGQQPTIICTDANTKVESCHALTIAIRSGRWTDLGSHFTDNKPEPTFSSSKDWDQFSWTSASRPDYILANKAGLSLIVSFRLRRDLSPLGHLGLEVAIRADFALHTFRTLKLPSAFQLPADFLSDKDEPDR